MREQHRRAYVMRNLVRNVRTNEYPLAFLKSQLQQLCINVVHVLLEVLIVKLINLQYKIAKHTKVSSDINHK